MLLETCLPREFFRGKVLLDAGCGNGKLTQQITTLGAETVGIDFSDSVVQAHARRSSPNVHYVRGDLQRPPFAAGAFDVVVSNGVLHHTPNTERAFQAVATCVRDGGAFYMWLYSKPESFVRRYLYYGGIDSVRAVASRLPPGGKRAVARAAAYLARAKYQTSGKTVDSETFNELIIGLMDTLTPRWRHYHTPVEVARWYFEAGFGAPTVSHWDNPYGFGVVATKQRLVATPGSNFDEQWSRRDAAKPPESLPAATA
ncbi:MAG: class I SAM-dependent methyltransferase [Gemmatimonadaceae bacterium]